MIVVQHCKCDMILDDTAVSVLMLSRGSDLVAGCLVGSSDKRLLASLRRLLVRFLFFVPNRLCCTREYTYIRHVAAAEGHLDICKFLVENGAHINRSDRWGASPLDDAYRHKHTKVLKYLRIHGAISGSSNQVANFITAAAEGDIDEVRTLLELFVDDTTDTISRDGEQQLQLIDKGGFCFEELKIDDKL